MTKNTTNDEQSLNNNRTKLIKFKQAYQSFYGSYIPNSSNLDFLKINITSGNDAVDKAMREVNQYPLKSYKNAMLFKNKESLSYIKLLGPGFIGWAAVLASIILYPKLFVCSMGPLPIIAVLSAILLLMGVPLMVGIYGIIKNHIKYNKVIGTYEACQNETYKTYKSPLTIF